MEILSCTGYSTIEALTFLDMPKPDISEDEILIQTAYCGVNFPDTLIVQGKYQFKPELPFSPGQEVSGIVAAVGNSNLDFNVGDEVLASMTFGGMREFALAKASNVYTLPKNVSPVDASVILESFATAYHALKDRAGLKVGDNKTLVVLGASGGTGMAAVQLGKLLCCNVIAVCSTQEKRDFAASIGADVVLPYTDLKNSLKQVGGADIIFDPVGGEISEQAFRAIKPGGKHLVVGFASGSVPAIPWNLPLLKSADIVGVSWGGFWRANPVENRQNVKTILDWFSEGLLSTKSPTIYPFDQAKEALKELRDRKAIGKVTLEF